MKRTLPLVLVAIAGGMTSDVDSQTRPDFSGPWTLEAEPAPAPGPGGPGAPPRGDMGSGWGTPITITQDADRLTVEYTIYSRYDLQPPLKFVYALDGSDSKNSVMLGRGIEVRTSRVSWDGSALNIMTTFTQPDPATGKPFTTEVKQTLSLVSPTSLAVDVTRSGALGGKPSRSRAVYRKS